MQATAWHKATVDSERRTRLSSSQVARSLTPIYFCFSAIHFSTEVSESGALVIVARTGKKVGGKKMSTIRGDILKLAVRFQSTRRNA